MRFGSDRRVDQPDKSAGDAEAFNREAPAEAGPDQVGSSRTGGA